MAQITLTVPVQVPVYLEVEGKLVPVGTATVNLETTGLKYDEELGRAFVQLAAQVAD